MPVSPASKSLRVPARLVELGLLAVVVLLPLIFDPYSALSFEAPKVVFFRWAVALLAFVFVVGRGSFAPCSRLDASVLAYAGIHAVATVGSVDPARSFWGSADKHGTFTLLCCVGFYFVLSRTLRSPGAWARLVAWLLVGTVPMALYGFVQFLGLDPLAWETDSVSNVLSTIGRSNFLGAYLTMLVPITLGRIASSRGRGLWAVVSLQVAAIVLSQARAAWLALISGAAVFAALSSRGDARRRLLVVVSSIVLIGLLVPLSHVDLSLPRREVREGEAESFAASRSHTVASRLAIWRCTVALVRDRWVLGYGPETFVSVFSERCSIAPPELVVDDPHNIFLNELVSTGVLGTFALVTLFVALFSTVLRAFVAGDRIFCASLVGSCVAYLVQAQFNPSVIVITMLFFTLLASARSSDVMYN